MNILGFFQRLGRALQLPIAVLPVAALLLRFGQPDLLNVAFIAQAGGAIFDNLALIFAIGVASSWSKDSAGAAALAGAAVSFAGLLSFVGLIVPHAVRRFTGQEALPLLVASALGGAGFVTLCDVLARVLFSPFELPVGIVLAFAGVPFFLWLLLRRREGHG